MSLQNTSTSKDTGLLLNVEDKPSFFMTLILAAQHLLAALGGIIAVPLVVGNVLELPATDTIILVNASLLISGVVTFVQSKGIGPVGIRLPSVMGTSFTFVAAALAIGFSEAGVAGILGSSLVGSIVMIAGAYLMPYIRKYFPPVVTGCVVMSIGLSLISVAVDWFAGGQKTDPNYASTSTLAMAAFVLIVVILLVQWGKGIFSAAAIFFAMLVGYIVALFFGLVDFTDVKEAQVFAVPTPFHFGLAFPISGIIGMSIAYLVTIVESNGNFLAIGQATNTKVTGEHVKRGVLCDGLGSALAACFSTLPFSSFAQNIGIISITRVASRYVVMWTGILLFLAGLFPVFGALIVSIPAPVLGGAGVMMFAMIIVGGIQMLDRVTRSRRNGLIIAISLGACLAVTLRPELFNHLPGWTKEIFSSGITTGSLFAIILDRILPADKEYTETENLENH
ncbi:nucleobase:cation symporter-2 family protein [Psittacicella gerlachiana]|uniref:Purine permease n=1 Tax=Psittacicella gerlachiana TaxID=2028574 RepID=A0A3A1YEX8_9GAMM|nr:nucleobase:cation symporter-2 family protein [Psittacicella gerlachiana]RIY36722.1 purine permease [Psittacicella gerlachiana]